MCAFADASHGGFSMSECISGIVCISASYSGTPAGVGADTHMVFLAFERRGN